MRHTVQDELDDRPAAAPRQPDWIAQPERSSQLALRFMVWVALTLGRPVARLVLYPTCAYFLLFSAKARAASRGYLGKVLGRQASLQDLFRHFHTFAATILDRVFLLNDQYGRFDVVVHGEDIVDEMLKSGEGCFLLGAHMGSFEIVRSLGRDARGQRVHLVMYEENARKMNAVLAAINPNLTLHVIPLGKVDAMLKVEAALQGGGFVGMLGDRSIQGEGTMPCQFLGAPARFAIGPFRLAVMLHRPIVLMLGIYRGANRYEVYFERLADLRLTNRSEREQVITEALQRYAERLEHYCRQAPYNWFNFYDFWK
jgi:predicted LPLAT superfamily acyltransferase